MNTLNQYQTIFERQNMLEKKLDVLMRQIFSFDESSIRPEVLRRWEKISQDLDRGKGKKFYSSKEVKNWVKSI